MSFNGNSDHSSDGITHVALGGHPSQIPAGTPAWHAALVAEGLKKTN